MENENKGKSFEREGEETGLEFNDRDDQTYWQQTQPGKNAQSMNTPRASETYDRSEDPSYWEAEETMVNSGRRLADSAKVKGTLEAPGSEQLEQDLELESQRQTGGSRSPNATSTQGKQDTQSKTRTSQPSPKRSNTETSSIHGAAENRGGDEQAQGITGRTEGEEDSRQKKVVSIRNDAKAAGKRTGSKKVS
ncbi:MAG TPA: hypothetical protein VGC88_07975 [Terriglobales bacterium]|jgi:hypothetical protein